MGCHKGDKIVLNDRTERKKKKKKSENERNWTKDIKTETKI